MVRNLAGENDIGVMDDLEGFEDMEYDDGYMITDRNFMSILGVNPMA